MFEGRLPAKLQEFAPKVVVNQHGHEVWEFEGQNHYQAGMNAVAGRRRAGDLGVAVAAGGFAGVVAVDHVAERDEEVGSAGADDGEDRVAARCVAADVLAAEVAAPDDAQRAGGVGRRRGGEVARDGADLAGFVVAVGAAPGAIGLRGVRRQVGEGDAGGEIAGAVDGDRFHAGPVAEADVERAGAVAATPHHRARVRHLADGHAVREHGRPTRGVRARRPTRREQQGEGQQGGHRMGTRRHGLVSAGGRTRSNGRPLPGAASIDSRHGAAGDDWGQGRTRSRR